MKRALLIVALLVASLGTTLLPSTAEARWGYGRGYARPYYGYNYGYRGYNYGYRPYGYYNYGYRPYGYYSYGYRPYYYNAYGPYYYNAYRPYYGGYGPGVGIWIR